MKQWAAYIRVSTTGQTVENQRDIIGGRWLQGRNIDLDWFQEVESTRKTRPIREGLMNDIRKGKYDGLVVSRLDRWGRSLSEIALSVDEMKQRNVSFASIADLGVIDTGSAMGTLQLHMMSAFAEFERSLIHDRTMEGLARAKSQGKTLGRPKGSTDSYKRRRSF